MHPNPDCSNRHCRLMQSSCKTQPSITDKELCYFPLSEGELIEGEQKNENPELTRCLNEWDIQTVNQGEQTLDISKIRQRHQTLDLPDTIKNDAPNSLEELMCQLSSLSEKGF